MLPERVPLSQLILPYVQGVLPVSGVVGVRSRVMLLSIVVGTLVEATSDQIDNLVVPLCTLTTLAASLQMGYLTTWSYHCVHSLHWLPVYRWDS